MDFQQLLSRLADEHRRLEQERNELSEEVSGLRKRLGSQEEHALTQGVLPGRVSPATRETVLQDVEAFPDDQYVPTVEPSPSSLIPRPNDAVYRHPSPTANPHGADVDGGAADRAVEFEVMWQPGEGRGSASAPSARGGSQWKSVRAAASGRRAAHILLSGEEGGGRDSQFHVRAKRCTLAGELDWLDDREHMSRARQNERFLEIFGLRESQQHTYTITAEHLRQVLAKRGLRNVKDGFLDKALRELARVSPQRRFKSGSTGTGALFGILPIREEASNPQSGIRFEAFVGAILLTDLPKRVEPSISRGIDKIQEALLKQDLDEVINKLSRQRVAMNIDMDTYSIEREAKAAWTTRIDKTLNVTVALTVLASIFCLGLSTETDPHWEGWIVLEITFAAVFVTDSVLRIAIYGWGTFWCGRERHWNWLDIFLTIISAVDVGLALAVQQADEAAYSRISMIFRALRVLRLGRLMKLMRSPMVRELTNMLIGFALGSPALFWVSIVLWVVVALCAISLRVAVGPDPGEDVLIEKCGRGDNIDAAASADPDCEAHKLYAEEYCGSLTKCMFTVFRCMIGDCTSTGGASLAAHLSEGYGIKFDFVYLTGMIVMIFGLFNVITAIFVEATMVGLKYNETKQKLKSVYEHQYVKRKLEELVHRIQCVSQDVQEGRGDAVRGTELSPRSPRSPRTQLTRLNSEDPDEVPDSAASTSLTEDEFFAVIEDTVVRRILMQLDVEVEGAGKEVLFDIMDPNDGGTVDVASMIETLMKLRGGPMKLDMIAPSVAIRGLQQEVRRLGSGLANLAVADRVGGVPKSAPKSDSHRWASRVEPRVACRE